MDQDAAPSAQRVYPEEPNPAADPDPSEGAADGVADGEQEEEAWWEAEGMPWKKEPQRADYLCLTWFGVIAVFSLILLPTRAWLLGVAPDDTEEKCRKMADKLCSLRIFEDENDKINLSLDDVGGELLVVSQFTLYGNCRKGRRPEFLSAARPEIAIPMYEKFVEICREKGYHVETGEFGAYMEVESLNDGPFTLIVDSADLDAPKKQ